MAKSLSARAKAGSAAGALPRVRADEREPVRRDPLRRRRRRAAFRPSLRFCSARSSGCRPRCGPSRRGSRSSRRAPTPTRSPSLQPARLRPRTEALARLCEALLDPRGADLCRSRRLQAGERPARSRGRRRRARARSRPMLARSVRASDTVARLGGDEFGLILWNLSEADAAAKAWALEAAVGEVSGRMGGRDALGRRLDRLCHARARRTNWPMCWPRPTTPCTPARRRGRAASATVAASVDARLTR